MSLNQITNNFYPLCQWSIGIMFKVLANGLGNWSSIPIQVISMTQKMVLDASLLYTQNYKVCIKVKRSNPGKGVAPSPTPTTLIKQPNKKNC